MRASLLPIALLLAACGSHAAEQPTTRPQAEEGTAARTPQPSSGPDIWTHTEGSVLCVVARRTQDLDTPTGSSDAVPGCKAWPDRDLAIDYTMTQHQWCGPCGFSLDAASSLAERATRGDACCYSVRSPPEPFGGQQALPPPAPPS